MTIANYCSPKEQAELTLQWDRLAEERHRQIIAGEDLSFDNVLVPSLLELFQGADTSLVLDIGSGTGDFTARLAETTKQVIGIEPSSESIAVARKTCVDRRNVRFINATLEDAAPDLAGEPITAAVACMTLMTAAKLTDFSGSLSRLLKKGSKFAAILCHPCFWPRYWRYESEPWFRYDKEIFVEAPFAISKQLTGIVTTHVHRPLGHYVKTFSDAGFSVESLVEPMPTPEIEARYPRPWEFPRFVGLGWLKVK